MFSAALLQQGALLLDELRARRLRLATAESCTGGLIAAALTELPGSSDVLERGFVTYSNAAKIDMLGVHATLIDMHGAVSAEVAGAMAEGALRYSHADIAVAVTGVAGPGGGIAPKPVGLVYVAAAHRHGATLHRELRLGEIGRAAVRLRAVEAAFEFAQQAARSMRVPPQT